MGRRRPLAGIAAAWILGVALGHAASPTPAIVWGAGTVCVAWAAALLRAHRAHWHAAVYVLVILLGALAYDASRLPTERLHPRLGELDRVQGVVTTFPTRTAERTEFVLDSERLPGGVLVRYWHRDTDDVVDIDHGDRLTVHTSVEVPPRLPGFDYRSYLTTRNVWGVAGAWNAGQIEVRSHDRGHPLLSWAHHARRDLFAAIDAHLASPSDASSARSNLLKGLFFGERSYMSDRLEGTFRDAGVMHVLAVSGLHLAILLSLGWLALRRLGRSVTQTYLILIPLVVLYLALVGFKLSLLRASLMLAFVALGWVVAERGWILKRWVDSLQGLSAAALVILIAHPPTLFNVSFQLSFSATAGILIVLTSTLPTLSSWQQSLRHRWSVEASRVRRWAFAGGQRLAMLGLITVAAQLAVAPVIAWHFDRLYVGAFLANLAIVPLATITLWIGVVFLALAALGLGGMAGTISAALGLLLGLLIDTAAGFASLPWTYVVVDPITLLGLLVLVPIFLTPWTTELLGGRYGRARPSINLFINLVANRLTGFRSTIASLRQRV